ncbi:hypothetical protein ACQP1V_42955 (plasmid) [Microtetraspora malaysiensis]|uniref:hypothetical protein n=1 Tax=Microtetraspora malaysiensis TaxID=161358 RepID=UPI003D8BBAC1
MRNEFLHQEQGYAYAAVSPEGGRNIYVTGRPCMRCAPRADDPNNTRPAPCEWARAHAWNTVNNWGGGAYVQRIPITELPPELRP